MADEKSASKKARGWAKRNGVGLLGLFSLYLTYHLVPFIRSDCDTFAAWLIAEGKNFKNKPWIKVTALLYFSLFLLSLAWMIIVIIFGWSNHHVAEKILVFTFALALPVIIAPASYKLRRKGVLLNEDLEEKGVVGRTYSKFIFSLARLAFMLSFAAGFVIFLPFAWGFNHAIMMQFLFVLTLVSLVTFINRKDPYSGVEFLKYVQIGLLVFAIFNVSYNTNRMNKWIVYRQTTAYSISNNPVEFNTVVNGDKVIIPGVRCDKDGAHPDSTNMLYIMSGSQSVTGFKELIDGTRRMRAAHRFYPEGPTVNATLTTGDGGNAKLWRDYLAQSRPGANGALLAKPRNRGILSKLGDSIFGSDGRGDDTVSVPG
jgi:hypothetical protein